MKTPQIPNLKLDNKRLAFTKETTNSSITGDKPGVIAGDIMKTPLSSRPEPNVVDWVKALDPQGKKGGKNGKKGKQCKGKHKRINPGLSQINGTSLKEPYGTNGTKQEGKHSHHSLRRPGGANGTSSEEQHGNNGTKKGGKHKHLGFKEPGGQNKTSDEQHVTNGTKKGGKHMRFGFKGPGGQNRPSYELKKGKEPIK